MLRATVFPIVLIFAAGTNAALLCCQSMATPAAECHHQELPALKILADNNNCQPAAVSIVALPREDVRRDVSARAADYALPVARYQVDVSTTGTTFWRDPWQVTWLEKRPLPTVLRI